jgi:ABC-type amino acid transport substrate-binding protein
MDFKDDNGNWTGFDAEFAEAVGKKMGVKVEFVEINWIINSLSLIQIN